MTASSVAERESVRPVRSAAVRRRLAWCWSRNWRLGWPERRAGLHYWLGYDYALALEAVQPAMGGSWLDVGTGAHSAFPYLFTAAHDVRMIGLDVTERLVEQSARTQRALRKGLVRPGMLTWMRADMRALPIDDGTVDGVVALSSIEHLTHATDDRQALNEIERVLRPGGLVVLTVPFRCAGSAIELVDGAPFQRHYSPTTLHTSLVGPVGLDIIDVTTYGERVPFYSWLRKRRGGIVDAAVRPLQLLATAAVLHLTPSRPSRVSAALIILRKHRP